MMKFILFLIFSFGLINLNLNKVYMIYFILMFMIFLKVNLMNLWIEIYSIFSLDFYSFYLIILTLWIIGVMLLIEMNIFSVFFIMLMGLVLVLSFSTFNLLMFYFLFEISLLPIFFLIKFDGYTFERFEAMLYMFFFTMLFSLPFLIVMMNILINYYSLMYFMFEIMNLNMTLIMYVFMLIGFLVKLPMFFIHIWLPKAHVEAPVYGSMILAGVLLKLGSYGILRMSQWFFILMMKLNFYLISFSLIGGLLLSLMCLIQIDLKMLVAYSSIVHMSMLISSLSVLSKLGFIGSYLMMIGHGLCSSGLFFIVNINYECFSSRLIYLNKGTINFNSILSMWWFLLCIGNFSAPISLSLVGEMLMLMSLVSYDFLLMIYLMMMCFFSAAYSLYLFSFSQHGNLNFIFVKFKEVSVKEYLILFLHVFPLNMSIFMLNLFMI